MQERRIKPGECPNCNTIWRSMNRIDADTEECPGCGCLLLHASNIEVINVTMGLPEKIKGSLVGLNLPAIKHDSVLKVPVEFASRIIERKSQEAAHWLQVDRPPWMNYLTFGTNEVKVIQESCVCYLMPKLISP